MKYKEIEVLLNRISILSEEIDEEAASLMCGPEHTIFCEASGHLCSAYLKLNEAARMKIDPETGNARD